MKKWVYLFNEVKEVEKLSSGDWDNVKALVGGKGAGLLDMTRAGVPVPPFSLSRPKHVTNIKRRVNSRRECGARSWRR